MSHCVSCDLIADRSADVIGEKRRLTPFLASAAEQQARSGVGTDPDGADQERRRSQDPRVLIQPITSETLSSYRRLITLLLPIRYSDRFFKDSVNDTSETALARVALWRDSSVFDSTPNAQTAVARVVGGIQCRVEESPSSAIQGRQLYIQTIAVLSPFRRLGIATNLLETIISAIIKYYENVSSVFAHVWEANVEAITWYEQRGFTVEDGTLDGYYRRLKPSGARVVRRTIGLIDHLAVRHNTP